MQKGYQEILTTELVKAEWNYKTQNALLQERLEGNIKKNGQIENLIVRELESGKLEVVNGNHRFDALEKLGVAKTFVFNLGKISDHDAKRIAVETNETKFESDEIELSNILKDLSKENSLEDLLTSLPYAEVELKGLIEQTSFDWNEMKPKKIQAEEKPKPLLLELNEKQKARFHEARKGFRKEATTKEDFFMALLNKYEEGNRKENDQAKQED